ncbi:Cytochrome P450 [Glycomyces sambucus]|uniref:Cytochrome P450 n=1 Tax=Glycomyces sambucus TaxID=380244 RepID=A0A1G9D9N0_9ACTN|nr:hypothetical protein [Glycomyces sambucus]SDK60577.1 Cytochrome P450 [Glycomyces sambucus]
MTTTSTFGADRAAELLAHPDLVPPLAEAGADGGLAWLRANVARFASGERHARYRGQVGELLGRMEPGRLRVRAAELAREVVAGAPGEVDVMAAIAREVPVRVLGEAVGIGCAAGGERGPENASAVGTGIADGVEVAAVRAVAAGYLSGEATEERDAAVESLVAACGGEHDEATAAKIGLLVQACEATAALIGNALAAMLGDSAAVSSDRSGQGERAEGGEQVGQGGDGEEAGSPQGASQEDRSRPGGTGVGDTARSAPITVAAELRSNPPVRATVRLAARAIEVPADPGHSPVGGAALSTSGRPPVGSKHTGSAAEGVSLAPGDLVLISLSDGPHSLPFGAGPHACPGRDQAIAIAIGVCEALRHTRLLTAPIEYEPLPNLRIPTRLEVAP